MYRLDITADLNDEDHTGYLWTFLDEARDPAQIRPGAVVVAGDDDAAAVCQVVDLVPGGSSSARGRAGARHDRSHGPVRRPRVGRARPAGSPR